MSGPPRASLVAHFLRYGSANLLVMMAGLVSFPITTRLLSSSDFGILSYWETSLLLAIAVIKLGSGESLMRFYPHGGGPRRLAAYQASLIAFPALLALLAWLILMLCLVVLWLANWLDHPLVAFLAMGQVLPAVWGAMALRVLQAREQSALNSAVLVLWRWLVVAGTLLMILYLMPTATGVLLARLLTHVMAVAAILILVSRGMHFGVRDFQADQAKEGLRYGLPIAVMEIGVVLTWSLDRWMLKWLLDDFSALGIYAIGMALASYIDQLISTALSQALGPVINRLYNTEGAEGVRRLKTLVLRPLIYAGATLWAGLIIGGHDFMLLLASADKGDASSIFILAGSVFLLRPILSTMSEGLLLQRRSKIVSTVTLSSALLGALLNCYFIPRFGIMGAAYTACLSVIGLQLSLLYFCPTELRVLPPAGVVLRALALAALAITLADQTRLFGLVHPAGRLAATCVCLLLCCVLPPLALDRNLRNLLQAWHRQRQAANTAGGAG
jgi:O-antigen/teichoic acid export membrane protein